MEHFECAAGGREDSWGASARRAGKHSRFGSQQTDCQIGKTKTKNRVILTQAESLVLVRSLNETRMIVFTESETGACKRRCAKIPNLCTCFWLLNTVFAAGQAYVALSHIRTLSGLIATDSKDKAIYCNDTIEESIATMPAFLAKNPTATVDGLILLVFLRNVQNLSRHLLHLVPCTQQFHIISFSTTSLSSQIQRHYFYFVSFLVYFAMWSWICWANIINAFMLRVRRMLMRMEAVGAVHDCATVQLKVGAWSHTVGMRWNYTCVCLNWEKLKPCIALLYIQIHFLIKQTAHNLD